MLKDLRYAFRTLLANRTFAAMAVLSLALGIGANTAIYSLMDAILVQTLPVRDPKALVVLQWHSKARAPIAQSINGSIWDDPQYGQVSPNLPWRVYEILRKDNPVLSQVVAYNDAYQVKALVQGQGHSRAALYVSGGFFAALGTPPAAGSLIGIDGDHDGAPPVAVVSYRFADWLFGDPARAVGQTVIVNDLSPSSAWLRRDFTESIRAGARAVPAAPIADPGQPDLRRGPARKVRGPDILLGRDPGSAEGGRQPR